MNLIKSIIRIIKATFLSAILLCMVLFMVGNRQNITIHLNPLFIDIETRVFLVIILFFILGMIFGVVLCSKSLIGSFFEKVKIQHKIKKLENDK